MSILHVVRCEQYEQCKQEFSFGTNTVASDFAPDTWITLFEGNPRLSEGWHFCSHLCLARWTMERIVSSVDLEKSEDWLVKLTDTPVWSIVRKPAQQEPQEQPACKARRFLLVDGETADIIECVKWGNGFVGIDPETSNQHGRWFYGSWEEFKTAYDGSGVQWIDQEVAE